MNAQLLFIEHCRLIVQILSDTSKQNNINSIPTPSHVPRLKINQKREKKQGERESKRVKLI